MTVITTLAAIDIGSNAIRLSIGSLDEYSRLRIEYKKRFALRLGTDAFTLGHFSSKTIESFKDVFHEIFSIICGEEPQFIKCFATSAMRNSDNAPQLIAMVKDKFAIDIEIINGRKEAESVFQAVKSKVDLDELNALLVDIGGGSLELSYVKDGTLIEAQSFELGTVRLLELQRESKGSYEKYLEQQQSEIELFLKKHIRPKDIIQLIGTGGNSRRLGKLRKQFFNKPVDNIIKLKEFDDIKEELSLLPPKKIASNFNMREERAEVITFAMDIYSTIIHSIPGTIYSSINLPKVGLIEGIFEEIKKEHIRFI